MEISNINKKQIAELLKKDVRLDGRKPLDYREIVIESNISKNAEGSARVKIGKTEVIIGVKLGIQEPYPDHEDEGTMMTSMEFSPASGSRYESGPPRINAIETARVVDRGIRESGFIDWKKLCIKKGEKVWSIAIDIYSINDDGNILDASAIGAVAALKLAKFPVYDEESESVKYGEFTDTPLPLTENIPFTMTFHKMGDKIFIDPNRDEEDSSNARVTFSVSKPKKEHMINAIQKGEVDSIKADELIEMADYAEKMYDEIYPKIEKQIKGLEK